MTARSLQSAERLCLEKGLAFTPLRRQVYELIAADNTPVGAYDLLDRLKKQRANAAPVTIYRALDFLLEAGLIHRIDALQAYAACEVHGHGEHEHADHGGLVLVCSRCKQLTEFEDPQLEREIERTALEHGFQVAHHLIEIRGLCGRCAADD
jgi:Fur family transcriptional regulator, zinc uptake regulator